MRHADERRLLSGACLVVVVLLLLLSGVPTPASAAIDWQWRTGRATNYGGSGDPWSIHHGSCRYNYLDPTVNKGWDVAALSDAVSDYQGSCGRCYEIGCAPMHLKDGYGTGLDRSQVCYDSSKTVVVMITDSCPCNYPPNQYSNKRWCCGDYYHLDVSTWAFEKLAARKWGVIGIRYREVPCSYCPENPAVLPSGSTPEPAVQNPPDGWQPAWDKRPSAQMCFKSSQERQDSGASNNVGGSGGSSGSGATAGSGSGSGSNTAGRDGSGSGGNTAGGDGGGGSGSNSGGKNSGSSNVNPGGASNAGVSNLLSLFPTNSLLSGWQDLTSKMNPWSATGADGRSAYCGTVEGYASLDFKGSTGSLMGKSKLVIDVKTSNGQVPDFTLNLSSSSKGTCRTLDLRGIEGAKRNGDWAQITIPLVNLSWWKTTWSWDDATFSGCSGSIGAWDVDSIQFKNKWGGRQSLCLANVKAY